MVTTAPIEPVLHCTANDTVAIEKQGFRLINDGMFKNNSKFPNIPIDVALFKPKVDYLHELNDTCKGDSKKIAARKDQSVLVHKDLNTLLLFAKPLCLDNLDMIQLSGFDSNLIPTAHTAAPQAVIKKIVKGVKSNSVKVMLMPASGLEKNKKENRSYIVLVFDFTTGLLLRIGCVSTDSRKLIVEDVELSKPFNYGVQIKNAAGINELSSKVKYTLTD